MKKIASDLSLALITLLSHLPFLSEGYGREFDAWSNVLNAKIISANGQYEVSRLPGHPLQEFLLSALYPYFHQAFFFNLLSALAAVAAVLFTSSSLRKLNLPSFWPAFCLAFTPALFLAAGSIMDYTFALAFIMGSFNRLLKKQYLWAGLLLGLATGFRISSLTLALPFFIMLRGQLSPRQWFFYGLSAFLMGGIFYLPAFFTYGWAFLDFHKPPFPGWASVLYKLSFGLWGLPLLLFIPISLFFPAKEAWPASFKKPNWWWGLLIIFLLQAMVFARLPFKSEFFIPFLPFFWISLGAYLQRRLWPWLAGAAVAGVFLFGFDYHNPWRGAKPGVAALKFTAGGKSVFFDPLKGPALLDREKRRNKSLTIKAARAKLKASPGKIWLISGWYWPELELKAYPERHHSDHYSSQRELDSARAAGYEIRYLPEIDQQNQIMEGHYLADSLGKDLLQP